MSGASGKTRPDSDRRAEGKLRVAVWLDPAEARALAALAALDPKREGALSRAVRQAILDAYEHRDLTA